tara:strand:+ start:54 stop:227 length:174 start_codon:yes stop_codon:yes gene_type:complete
LLQTIKIVKVGEKAYNVFRRKVLPGTRFLAEVFCIDDNCATTWKDFDCCYDTNLDKY